MASEDTGTRIAFRLLGPLEVAADGRQLAIGGPRQRALLALLLLRPNEVVSRGRLIEGLWGENPPATAANALQVAIHGLRQALGADRIVTKGAGYALRVEPGELDVEEFETLVARARAAEPAAAAGLLGEALGMWRGAPLSDLEAPFAQAAGARLEEQRMAALEERIDADLALSRHAAIVAELEMLVAEHPYRERLRAQLIVSLYRSRRQADALAAYQRARETMVEELGIDPSPELQELERAILRQDASLAAPRPAERLANDGHARLPVPATPLVGRQLEAAAVTGLLRRDDVRLVTLTGPGGTGKTRLALAAAAEIAGEFVDGATFVDLAPLEDPELVASAIAHTLELSESEAASPQSLKRALASKQALLVLDNFERVDEAAPLVSELLAAAGDVKVLATSRAVLRLSGEHEYPVPPLRTPDPERAADLHELARNEAVALFVARAQAVRPDFALSDDNGRAVAQLCVALEGLPLALELAAAQVRTLSPAGLVARLEQRLDVLTGGPRDAPERQRTLRATIDWSHDLLSAPEQQLFRRVAVFAGGFDLEAAEAVCGAALDTLVALVDKSLLQRHDGPAGEPRLRMLETVREYALELLDATPDADALRSAHAAHFAELAGRAAVALWGPVQGPDRDDWLDRLQADHDNFRGALAWLGARDPHAALGLSGALFEFWASRGYVSEGRGWLERTLTHGAGAPTQSRAKALHAAAYLAYFQGDYERGDELGEQSLALYRQLGDREGVGRTVHVLGWAAAYRGDDDRAAALAEESLSLARELGHARGVIVSLGRIAGAALKRREHDRAEALLDEGLALAREHRDRIGEAGILGVFGELAGERGDERVAERLFAEALVLCYEDGYTPGVAAYVHHIALRFRARGLADEAIILLGAAEAMRESAGVSLAPSQRQEYEDALERARATLGADVFATLRAAGRSAPLDEIVDRARSVAMA